MRRGLENRNPATQTAECGLKIFNLQFSILAQAEQGDKV
jgi:hypothetical protein